MALHAIAWASIACCLQGTCSILSYHRLWQRMVQCSTHHTANSLGVTLGCERLWVCEQNRPRLQNVRRLAPFVRSRRLWCGYMQEVVRFVGVRYQTFGWLTLARVIVSLSILIIRTANVRGRTKKWYEAMHVRTDSTAVVGWVECARKKGWVGVP